MSAVFRNLTSSRSRLSSVSSQQSNPERYQICLLGAGGVGKSAITIRIVSDRFLDKYDPTIEDIYLVNHIIDESRVEVQITDTAGQEEFSSLCDGWIRESDGFLLVFSVTDPSSLKKLSHFKDKIDRVLNERVSAAETRNRAILAPLRAVSSGIQRSSSSHSRRPGSLSHSRSTTSSNSCRSTSDCGSSSSSSSLSESINPQKQDDSNQTIELESLLRPPILILGNKSDLINDPSIGCACIPFEMAEEHCAKVFGRGRLMETSAKTGLNVKEAFDTLIRELRSQTERRREFSLKIGNDERSDHENCLTRICREHCILL